MRAFTTKRVKMAMCRRETETEQERDRRQRQSEHGELRHCLAESPVISRSWTCRDSWWGWRSGVHTVTEISAGGESALWPPTLPTHPSTALTPPHAHSSHTLTIGLSIFLSLFLTFSPSKDDILLHVTEKVYTCLCSLPCSEHDGNMLISTKKDVNVFGCSGKHK